METPKPRRIQSAPLTAASWIDGCQFRGTAARYDHRDVTCVWVAAGAVRGKSLLHVEERLAVLCSVEDEERVRSALPDVPVVALAELLPWGVASATDDWIDLTRRHLEAAALENAPQADGAFIVVDGSLPAASQRRDAVSVVKTTSTDWLQNPALIPAAGGWRSPALCLPPERADERPRLTCFVRLRDAAGSAPWDFSLIRVECFEDAGLDVLDAAAALAVTQRQPLNSGDPRAEVHLLGFRRAEEVLRTRAPFAIQVLP